MIIENEPPAGTPLTSRELASNDGWAQHPDSPPHGFKGQEVLAWAEIEAKYPPVAATPAAPPAPPPAPPAPPPAPTKTPEELAAADGWAVHPNDPAFWFKGQEVLPTAEVLGKFGGANAGTGATAGAGTTATTGASPSSAEVPADVQDLLNKWTGGDTAA
jgi:hypothetical protein